MEQTLMTYHFYNEFGELMDITRDRVLVSWYILIGYKWFAVK